MVNFELLLQNSCNTAHQKFPGAFGTLQGYRSSQFAGECFVGLQVSTPNSKNQKQKKVSEGCFNDLLPIDIWETLLKNSGAATHSFFDIKAEYELQMIVIGQL